MIYKFRSFFFFIALFIGLSSSVKAQSWDLVDFSELTETDIFMIVDTAHSKAMPNNATGSSQPSAIAITLSADRSQITSEENEILKWHLSGNLSDGYMFYPNGTTSTWLNYNNTGARGLRVNTSNNNKFFTIQDDYLYNLGRSYYIGVYNNQDWRGYSTIHANILQTRIAFYRYTDTPSAVATPEFSVPGGTYLSAQTVAITCDDPATIFYTTDGTRPSATSAVYTEPLIISQTTTLKAIAVIGTDTSRMATATYVLPIEVPDIATLRSHIGDDRESLYRLTGSAFVTYTGSLRNQKFIQDDAAGIMIDDTGRIISQTYAIGDEITGLIGRLTTYNGMMEFAPVADPGAPVSTGNAITPILLDISQIGEEYEARLVTIHDVTISGRDTFANSMAYQLNGASNPQLYIRYAECDLIGTDVPAIAQDITGVIYDFNGTYEIVPRDINDIVAHITTCTQAPVFNTCNAELLPNDNLLFTASLSSIGNEGCSITHHGFVYSTVNSEPVLNEPETDYTEVGTAIAPHTDFSYELNVRGFDPYYVRAYAINEADTSYSTVTSILPVAPAQYTLHFVTGNSDNLLSDIVYTEGEAAVLLDAAPDCSNMSFVGWTLEPIDGSSTVAPELYTSFIPTQDTTLYAVYSKNGNADMITINRSCFESTVTAYGTEDAWTAISETNGDTITGMCDLYTYNNAMQVNTTKGALFYNTTGIPGEITAISMTGYSTTSPRIFTPYISTIPLNRDNFSTDGSPLMSQTVVADSTTEWVFTPSNGENFFYLALNSGAAYIDNIVISYSTAPQRFMTTPVDTVNLSDRICSSAGGYVDLVHGFEIEEPETGIYTRTEADDICSTLYILNLTVDQPDTTHQYISGCGSYTLEIGDDTYQYFESTLDTITVADPENVETCPISIIYHITILQPADSTIDLAICRGDLPYTFGDTIFENGTLSGTYIFANTHDTLCNGTLTLNLTVNHGIHTEEAADMCGTSYFWDDEWLDESGYHSHYSTNANGCQDTVSIYLNLWTSDTTEFYAQICEGEYYSDNGFMENENGTFTQYLQTEHDCDSIVILHLTVGSATTTELQDETCENTTYNEYGFELTELTPGILDVYDTITRIGTCDSIVHLQLMVKPVATTTESISICQNETASFQWNGLTYAQISEMTPPMIVLTAENSCDSVVYLLLTVKESKDTNLYVDACDSFEWNDTILRESGTYTMTETAANDCDSIITLHLTIFNSTYSETSISTYNSYLWGDSLLTTSGDYTQTLTNHNNCDSIVTLHLEILHEYTVTFDINGNTDIEPAQSYVTGQDPMNLPMLNDCGGLQFLGWTTQSIATPTTTIPEIFTTFTPSENSTLYAVFGTQPEQDSIIINRSCFANVAAYGTVDQWQATSVVNSTIISGEADLTTNARLMQMRNSSRPHPYNTTALPGNIATIRLVWGETGSARPWTPYIAMNELTQDNFLTEGTALDTKMLGGPDTIIEWNVLTPATYFYLNLADGANYVEHITIVYNTSNPWYTTNTTDYVTIDTTICQGDSYVDEHFNENEEGTYTATDAEGFCSTIYTLHLAIHPNTNSEFDDRGCNSYTWNDSTYTESGDYVQTFMNANGCDSVVSLHLTIFHADTTEFADMACESYSWNDSTFTESGDYVQIFTNANGCDSVVTLHLTIFHADTTEFADMACESYSWNDSTITESGDYVLTFTNANGCDSVVSLHLTIFHADTTEFADMACESYSWNDSTFTESGDYVLTFTNANGCDSVVTLHLTIYSTVTQNIEITLCESDLPYLWNGVTFEEAGTQTAIFTTQYGCDSTINMTVNVTEIDLGIGFTATDSSELIANQENATYQWIDCESNTPIVGATGQSFRPETSGRYACIITMGECSDTTVCEEIIVTGINDYDEGFISLYPNPTSGSITIQLNAIISTTDAEIQLFDVYGKRLQIMSISSDKAEIDLSQYAPGIYLIELTINGKVITVRKVVKR